MLLALIRMCFNLNSTVESRFNNLSKFIIGLLIILPPFQLKAEVPATNSDCLLLGPKPSFIMKLPSSSSQFLMSKKLISTGFSSEFSFSHTLPMSNGYLLAFLQPRKTSLFSRSHGVCYAKKDINHLIASIKQQLPQIKDITPNFLSSVMEISPPDAEQQWNLHLPPGGINAVNTWLDFTRGEPSISIAILDTGMIDNDDLRTNIIPGVYFTEAGKFGVSATPSCQHCANAQHGTVIAGIIASTGTYEDSIYGVAPHSMVLPINVFTQFDNPDICGPSPCLYSYLSDQINALHWLAGAQFPNLPAPSSSIVGINMSFGNLSPCPVVAQNALDQINNRGLSIVVAAGNHNTDARNDYPANCNHVISVAATGFYGERASYSNWGQSVTIAAPGGNAAHGIWIKLQDTDKRYTQGTSLAAPHVAGVIALLYSIDANLNPEKIKAIITAKDAVTPFPSSNLLPEELTPCNEEYSCGAGIINAYQSLAKALSSHSF